MKQVYSLLMVVAVAATMVGCQQAKVDRSLLIAHRPRTIVVVPPLNNTADVSASEAFLSTVTRPLAETRWWEIDPVAAGVFGVPVGAAVLVVASALSRPDPQAAAFVERLREPPNVA